MGVGLPGKGNLNSHCARLFHQIISMIKWTPVNKEVSLCGTVMQLVEPAPVKVPSALRSEKVGGTEVPVLQFGGQGVGCRV